MQVLFGRCVTCLQDILRSPRGGLIDKRAERAVDADDPTHWADSRRSLHAQERKLVSPTRSLRKLAPVGWFLVAPGQLRPDRGAAGRMQKHKMDVVRYSQMGDDLPDEPRLVVETSSSHVRCRLRLPGIERAFRHPVLAAEISALPACLRLPQDPNCLVFDSYRLLHRPSLPRGGL